MHRLDLSLLWVILTGVSVSPYTAAQVRQDKDVLFTLGKHTEAVKSVAFSPDGSMLASGSDDKTLILWDTRTGEAVTTIANNFFPVNAVRFFGNDQLMAASGPDIKLIDFQGRIIRTYAGKTGHIWSIDVTVSRGMVTGGSYGKVIRVWDIDTGNEIAEIKGHEKSTLPVCFSPGGDRILSGSLDRTVRLWNADSGKERMKMDIHTDNIFSVAFHPGGRHAASASGDRTVRLWDLETGKVIQSYAGHQGAVLDVEFSPDGRHLLSASADHTIILWETISGKKLYVFTDHTASVNDVEYSAGGSTFASASDDCTARIWKLEKRMFVDACFSTGIGNAVAGSPLFGAKQPGESRQEYRERQDKAAVFLEGVYEDYYRQYLQQLNAQDFNDLKQ